MWETWHTPPNLLAVNPMIENVLALNKEDTPQNRSEEIYVDIKLQCCGSGMFIPDPGSKSSNERQGRKKNSLSYHFFGAINFTKLNYFIFEMLKKKIWANFQIIIELFTQKIVTRLSKIWVWDPGSRGQKGTGSRIRISNTVKLREWYGAFLMGGPLAEDSVTKLKSGQLNVCTVYVYCVWCTLFPLVTEICASLAGSFCQKLTTVKSGAYVFG